MLGIRRRTRAEMTASGDARSVEFTLRDLNVRAEALRGQHDLVAAILAGEAPAPPRPVRPRPAGRVVSREAWRDDNDYFVDCATRVTLKWIEDHSYEAFVPSPAALRDAMEAYMYHTSASRYRDFEQLK